MTTKPEVRPDQPQLVSHTAYDEFQAREGIPIITGFSVADLRTLEVKPWARLACLGAYINLDGTGGTNDAYVAEIEPGKKMAPERHLFEKNIYVLEGRGATMVGEDPNSRTSFEWKRGSVFSVPINTWHQHVNGSGTDPARFVAITTAPLVMNYFHNDDFIFNNPFIFEDRVGTAKQFQGEGTLYTGGSGRTKVWETNFIPDIETFTTFTWKERGAGGASVFFELADNTQAAHVSQFPVGTYKKAHRHGPGAHVIIISGVGYSLLWPMDGSPTDRVERVDWKVGSMVVPPTNWFHQHFNGGTEPARYLALRWGSQKHSFPMGSAQEGGYDISVKDGGAQIEYEDEASAVHDMFEETLARGGGESKMGEFIPRLRK
ncbi:MAG: cupin domain-containing protein [Planctomycetota bacterium]|nr:cupin domain-containing protein [Planctomycetota bacterium]